MMQTPLRKLQRPSTPVYGSSACKPYRCRVTRRVQENDDTFTVELAPVSARQHGAFNPGQFNMLYIFGLGEIPISISGDPADPDRLVHTTRAVGAVTRPMRDPEARRRDRRARTLRHALAARRAEG